ncbi:SCO0930 family lipoprotein [Streptomyces sp. CT34]|uniref:SCO0930 family lipoprotein n=1 Tax=Streptomyces sp. CT34 TaxID=1553907 RepID=UPI00099B4B00|nr:SCO0930 family lipoprotein [Streptomyces sp. CT34]
MPVTTPPSTPSAPSAPSAGSAARRHAVLAVTALAAALTLTTACGSGGSGHAAGSGSGTDSVQPAGQGTSDYGGGYGSTTGGGYGGQAGGDSGKPAAAGKPAGALALHQSATLGPVVTDAQGMTLYRFDKDTAKPPMSNCSGDCATTWPPVPADGATAPAGIAPDALGSVTRADGTKQLTVNGWPAYRYAKDTKPGDTKGHGVGGTWHALASDGTKAGAQQPGDVGVFAQPQLGRILVDGMGRTLYRFNKDSAWPMKFGCTGTCLDTWKPAKPADRSKLNGIAPHLVSTVTRPDGTRQLAIDCWPVYWFTGDKQPGDINGQGKMGLWFAVSENGKKNTKSVSGAAGSGAAGSGAPSSDVTASPAY